VKRQRRPKLIACSAWAVAPSPMRSSASVTSSAVPKWGQRGEQLQLAGRWSRTDYQFIES
jgi:hypothetical protein